MEEPGLINSLSLWERAGVRASNLQEASHV